MHAPPDSRTCLRGPGAGWGALLFLLAGVAGAQTPGGKSSLPPITREELMRRFDLDSDGKIDPAEADIGRAKMRQERLDQERKREIDPLTGRPRGEADDAQEAEPPPRKPITSLDDLLPSRAPVGSAIRDGKAADGDAGREREKRRRKGASKEADAKEGRGLSSARDPQPGSGPFGSGPHSQRDPAPPRGPLTGGIRAGAPPARPGYGATTPDSEAAGGASSRKDRPLNAGRPRDTLLPGAPSAAAPGGGGTAAGALPRSTSRSGATSGVQSGRSPQRSASPAPPPRRPLLPDRPDK